MYVSEIVFGKGWTGTALDAQHLRYIKRAIAVVFDGPQITDAYLKPIGHFSQLGRLAIKRSPITDEGLVYLQNLQQLGQLEIFHCPITDASVAALAQIPVTKLMLYGTNLSTEGVQRLAKHFPGADALDVRQGGFLGIGGNDLRRDQVGFMVNQVQRDSAAEQAGLMIGDFILKYDGKEVRSFPEIKDLIAENKVGESVEIEFMRDNEQKKVTVTLGEWP